MSLVPNSPQADEQSKHPTGREVNDMTTTDETTTTPDVPSTPAALVEAEVLTYDNVGMPATSRCDRCGAQAYVQLEVNLTGKQAYDVTLAGQVEHIETGSDEVQQRTELLFCGHHAVQYVDAAKADPEVLRIFDHRDFLLTQERRYKGQD